MCRYFYLGASKRLPVNGKNYFFVTYGHSVEINCSLTNADVNVTLYVRRFQTPKRLAVDNVKVRLNKGIFTITRTNSMDGGEYICEATNRTGHKRISHVINVIPVIPKNSKFGLKLTHGESY